MASPLKIGIVCYPTIGGSGIVATELGLLLAESGHEIHFISYEQPVRLRIKHPNWLFHPVLVNEYALFKYPDYTLPLSVRIAEVSREFQLDILHVHYAVPHAAAALLARLMLGDTQKPAIITTLHGTDTNLLGNDPHYRPIIKYSIENSCGITTVSESLKNQTISTFGIKKSIEVIPNFFAPRPPKRSAEVVRKSLGVTEGETLLLHMSNLRPGKRVNDILEAVSLAKNVLRLKLLILAGESFKPYESAVRRLGLDQRILVKENVQDIDDYLNACNFGIYASEEESFGLSILETLAHGKPVVATNTGGIPEVVQPNKTGLLVPVGNPKLLAAAIDQLVNNPAQIKTFGDIARSDAATRFNPVKIRDHYLSYYLQFL
ncbi:MAG: N-acetyl-alpha-D-glucosaminyl L-malate synthase BshA [Chthoniobacterales bacterium]